MWKHGCCSEKLILDDERQEDLDDLKRSWLDDYPPTGSRSLEAVLRAAEAEWMLNRKTRDVQECEHQLQGKSALEWTEEEHKKLERFLRYRTTAERSFYRARQVLEQTRRNAVMEEEKVETLAGIPLNRKPVVPIPSLQQYLEIRNVNGGVLTTMSPTNAELIEKGRTMQPPPELVVRRMNFPHGFPVEYQWVKKEIPGITTYRVQKLPVDLWLKLVEREEASGTGHIGPRNIEQDSIPEQPSGSASPRGMLENPATWLLFESARQGGTTNIGSGLFIRSAPQRPRCWRITRSGSTQLN